MPPYPESNSLYNLSMSNLEVTQNKKNTHEAKQSKKRTYEIVWTSVLAITTIHVIALYGLYLTTSAKLATILYTYFMYNFTGFGITGGTHRLWAHRSYKVKLPLKLILLFSQTMSHQNSVIEWCRDHRAHHKFEETDADPHNALNGFFFSHMGWLMCKKHEDVKTKGKGIDLSDLYADPLLRFQKKYFMLLMIPICFILPSVIPMLLWNETFVNSFCLNMFRYVFSLHVTWLVNSWAHVWGNKPYDKNRRATQSAFVALVAGGEGWHNYHHVFPWDYRTSEFGKINFTLKIINMFAKIGWAYDLKSASKEMIKHRVERSGDGSHEIWGWGDKDQTDENKKYAIIYNKKED